MAAQQGSDITWVGHETPRRGKEGAERRREGKVPEARSWAKERGRREGYEAWERTRKRLITLASPIIIRQPPNNPPKKFFSGDWGTNLKALSALNLSSERAPHRALFLCDEPTSAFANLLFPFSVGAAPGAGGLLY